MPRKPSRTTARSGAARPGAVDNYVVEAPAERWQRGVEKDFAPVERGGRAVQRVGSGLIQLRAGATINDSEYVAALRWQRDAEPACEGTTNPEVRSNTAGPDAWMVARVDGESRHREACRAVGESGVFLLRTFVSEQLSIRSVASRTAEVELREWEAAGRVGRQPFGESTNRRRITEDLTDTLKRLAEHYADVDSARRAAAKAARVAAAPRPTVQDFTPAEKARVAAMDQARREQGRTA